MNIEERVFIAGAGPVGLTAAASLVRAGIPVTVFESGPGLGTESRASTFHASTLDMLDELGVAGPLIETGLVAPRVQYRTTGGETFAEFDFGAIADATRHPFRLQAEQSRLTRILLDRLADEPQFRIEFDRTIQGVSQDEAGVSVEILGPAGRTTRRARWLIGTDGARSAVRHALGVEFEGYTWPERFLVVSTPFDFRTVYPDLAAVSYFTGAEGWHFLLRIPGLWRAMFPVDAAVSDTIASGQAHARARLASIGPDAARCEIAHTTLYRVHQRVARTFRVGHVFLAGDAAHVNNPLGGMGMNGGIHDAVNLTQRLARVWKGAAPQDHLDGYDRQRRQVTLDSVQKQTVRNKRDLEARDPESRQRFREEMCATARDPRRAREFLLRASMLESLRRSAELD